MIFMQIYSLIRNTFLFDVPEQESEKEKRGVINGKNQSYHQSQ